MMTPDVRRNWESIRSELPGDYESLAFETKAIKPHYPNVQITKPDDLLRMIFLHVGANLPLRQTVAWFAETGGPKVSPYCLHTRMRAAGAYLSALVARMTTWRSQCAPELWDGSHRAARLAARSVEAHDDHLDGAPLGTAAVSILEARRDPARYRAQTCQVRRR